MSVGRNEPCPCGSGKKFKRCCNGKVSEDQLLANRNILEPGSYRVPGGYFPSIANRKLTRITFVLVRRDVFLDNEAEAARQARLDLTAAGKQGSAVDLAMHLRGLGYASLEGFNLLQGA